MKDGARLRGTSTPIGSIAPIAWCISLWDYNVGSNNPLSATFALTDDFRRNHLNGRIFLRKSLATFEPIVRDAFIKASWLWKSINQVRTSYLYCGRWHFCSDFQSLQTRCPVRYNFACIQIAPQPEVGRNSSQISGWPSKSLIQESLHESQNDHITGGHSKTSVQIQISSI